MSKRKDRAQFTRMRCDNPRYLGFRGYINRISDNDGSLSPVNCSLCGKKRNVHIGNIPTDKARYVCLSCQD